MVVPYAVENETLFLVRVGVGSKKPHLFGHQVKTCPSQSRIRKNQLGIPGRHSGPDKIMPAWLSDGPMGLKIPPKTSTPEKYVRGAYQDLYMR